MLQYEEAQGKTEGFVLCVDDFFYQFYRGYGYGRAWFFLQIQHYYIIEDITKYDIVCNKLVFQRQTRNIGAIVVTIGKAV